MTAKLPGSVSEGWLMPDNARSSHYFVNGFSLCNRWMVFSMEAVTKERYIDEPPCKTCHRLWLKRKEEEAT